MDSGQLDSHMDFGINAPLRNRIKLRRVCTCAPIRHDPDLFRVVSDSAYVERIYVNVEALPTSNVNYTCEYAPVPGIDGVAYTLE
jgi:hypothetical protein